MNPDGLVVVRLLLLPGSTLFFQLQCLTRHTHTQRLRFIWFLKIKIQKLPQLRAQPSFLFASFHARLRFGKDYKVLIESNRRTDNRKV